MVRMIPEELLVAAVRNDMVDRMCWRCASRLCALTFAQRVVLPACGTDQLSLEPRSVFLPAVVIEIESGGWLMECGWFVDGTVELTAARLATGFGWKLR